jgi:hypothetical protein
MISKLCSKQSSNVELKLIGMLEMKTKPDPGHPLAVTGNAILAAS